MLKQRGRQMHPGFGTPGTPVTTGQLSRAGQCWQGWAQWTLVTMTRAGTPGHLITYWHRSPHSSHTAQVLDLAVRCSGHPGVPINTLEPGLLSPVSPLLTLHRRRWWRWRCQHKPDTFSANLSECQPAGRAPACTSPEGEPWGGRRSRQQFLIL